jgi:hypothetical protein
MVRESWNRKEEQARSTQYTILASTGISIACTAVPSVRFKTQGVNSVMVILKNSSANFEFVQCIRVRYECHREHTRHWCESRLPQHISGHKFVWTLGDNVATSASLRALMEVARKELHSRDGENVQSYMYKSESSTLRGFILRSTNTKVDNKHRPPSRPPTFVCSMVTVSLQ